MDIAKEAGGLGVKIRQYLKETEAETKKVVWPDRKFVAAATIIILAIVLLSTVYTMLIDYGFTKFFEALASVFKTGI